MSAILHRGLCCLVMQATDGCVTLRSTTGFLTPVMSDADVREVSVSLYVFRCDDVLLSHCTQCF